MRKFKIGDRVNIVGDKYGWMFNRLGKEPWNLVLEEMEGQRHNSLCKVKDTNTGKVLQVYFTRLELVTSEIVLPPDLFTFD